MMVDSFAVWYRVIMRLPRPRRPAAPSRARPSAARPPAPARPGRAEVGGRHDRLAAIVQPRDEHPAAIGVELAHDVVEQHQRGSPALDGQHRALGEQQRQQREPLLALGAERLQLASVAQQQQLVAVRTVLVKPRSTSEERRSSSSAASSAARRPSSSAGSGPPRRRRVRARPPAGGSPRQHAPPRRRDRRAARCPSAPARRPRHPASPRRRGRRAQRAQQRVARCAIAREYCARLPARAGHRAATSWSRCARRSDGAPLTSSSRSGRKTLTSGRAGLSVSRSTGTPSTLIRFGSPGWKPTLSVCAPSRSDVSTSTRAAGASKRTMSRSLAVRTTAPCSRSTAPRAGSTCPRRWVRAAPSGPDPRRRRPSRRSGSRGDGAVERAWRGRTGLHVQADRHDQVEEAALVGALDQAGPQGADELEDQVVRPNAVQAVAQELRVEADLERLAGEPAAAAARRPRRRPASAPTRSARPR